MAARTACFVRLRPATRLANASSRRSTLFELGTAFAQPHWSFAAASVVMAAITTRRSITAASVQQLLQPLGDLALLFCRWPWLFGARIGDPPVKEAAHGAKQSNLAACKTLHRAEFLLPLLRSKEWHAERK